jgi:DNA-binding Xre family transcriptional regulator
MIRLRVREVAEAKRLTISELSRKSDVDMKTVRAVFRNPDRVVTTTILNRLANGLEVDARELIDYTPDPKG